jgi:signal transduction protein with GAF and PtsI domain
VIGEGLNEVCSIYLCEDARKFATRLAREAVHVTRMAIGEGWSA